MNKENITQIKANAERLLAEAEQSLWESMNRYERLFGREKLNDFARQWPLSEVKKPF